jgi:hypothetical protein
VKDDLEAKKRKPDNGAHGSGESGTGERGTSGATGDASAEGNPEAK